MSFPIMPSAPVTGNGTLPANPAGKGMLPR